MPLARFNDLTESEQNHVLGLIALKNIADWKGYSMNPKVIKLAPATIAKINRGDIAILAKMDRRTVKTITTAWCKLEENADDFPAELLRVTNLTALPIAFPQLNNAIIKYMHYLQGIPAE